MRFLPFHDIRQHKRVVVVDSRHPLALMLSHWRGAQNPTGLEDDTSTGIVLNAIRTRHDSLSYDWVSNNHFDIDGFLGVWAMLYPEKALVHESTLREAALIGDFREYNPAREGADAALKLVCWINHLEKTHFYQPFGEKDEARSCVPKYHYFLHRLAAFLDEPTRFEADWQEEYQMIQTHCQQLTRSEIDTDIRLLRVEAKEPLHYYALFGQSREADMVLSQYSGNRYELEYTYTSWVDTAHRLHFPRLHFDPLAQQFNQLEENGCWVGDSIMDTGPQLRLERKGDQLSKAARYAHPFEREIHASSINPTTFAKMIRDFYHEKLAFLSPMRKWTWAAMRSANEKVAKRMD
ncbi:MAG: DUF6687 family protein [Bacteroidota bacterium]